MNQNNKLNTLWGKIGVPSAIILCFFPTLVENWSFWPLGRKIGLFIFILVLFWVFWHNEKIKKSSI